MGHHHHGHDHSHDHSFMHGRAALGRAFALNTLFTMVEAAGAWWTDSAAVMSGAMHDAGDCLVLGAAWYFQHLATRGRDDRYSFGYARFSMLGGWLASLVLCVGSIGMIAFTVLHGGAGHGPATQGIMLVAAFGLVMNFLAMWVLREGRSLNERGARLHLIEDVLSWAAVLAGGAIMHFTHWRWIDPVLSIAIALYVLINALRVLREGTSLLMQGKAAGLDGDRIAQVLRALPDVEGVHDLHSWSLDGHYTVLTVHIVTTTTDPERVRVVKAAARKALDAFGVQHATIEMEHADESCSLSHH